MSKYEKYLLLLIFYLLLQNYENDKIWKIFDPFISQFCTQNYEK